MTTIKVSNGMMETTHVEGNAMLYKRLRVKQHTTTQIAVPVVEDSNHIEVVHAQIPPAHWKGTCVQQPTSNVVHVDFGYQPQPKKPKKKLQRIIRELLRK